MEEQGFSFPPPSSWSGGGGGGSCRSLTGDPTAFISQDSCCSKTGETVNMLEEQLDSLVCRPSEQLGTCLYLKEECCLSINQGRYNKTPDIFERASNRHYWDSWNTKSPSFSPPSFAVTIILAPNIWTPVTLIQHTPYIAAIQLCLKEPGSSLPWNRLFILGPWMNVCTHIPQRTAGMGTKSPTMFPLSLKQPEQSSPRRPQRIGFP